MKKPAAKRKEKDLTQAEKAAVCKRLDSDPLSQTTTSFDNGEALVRYIRKRIKPAPKRKAWRPSTDSVWAGVEAFEKTPKHFALFRKVNRAIAAAAKQDGVTR